VATTFPDTNGVLARLRDSAARAAIMQPRHSH
jgi:hypothetical protein